jgi:hypothetical protein
MKRAWAPLSEISMEVRSLTDAILHDVALLKAAGNPAVQCTYKNGACKFKQTGTVGPYCSDHSCPSCGAHKRTQDALCKPCEFNSSV